MNVHTVSAATLVFTSSSFAGLLENILLELSLCDVLRACTISKHVNAVIADSSLIQLAIRTVLHQLLPSNPNRGEGLASTAAPGVLLNRVLERERRLATWTPKEIRCLHLPDSQLTELQDGHLLFLEHFNREPVRDPADGLPPHYHVDGWTVKDLNSDQDAHVGSRPATWGLGRSASREWKGRLSREGGRIHHVTFCPQDNVVAVARRFGPVFSERLQHRVFVNRFYFYTMRHSNKDREPSEVHRDSALPFIEFLTPYSFDDPLISEVLEMQVIPGGRLVVKEDNSRGFGLACVTMWDWKQGLCFHRLEPWSPCTNVFSARFLTPDWLICATRRSVRPSMRRFEGFDFSHQGQIPETLLGFDLFALDPELCAFPPVCAPLSIAWGAEPGTPLCSWNLEQLAPTPRLCNLYLPPISQSATTMRSFRVDDLQPRSFEIACPVSSSLTRISPGVLSFSIEGVYNDEAGSRGAIHGAIGIRAVLAAGLCGAFRNFALKAVRMGVDPTAPPKSRHEGVNTSYDLDDDMASSSSLESAEDHGGVDKPLHDWRCKCPLCTGRQNEPIMIPWSVLREHCTFENAATFHCATSYGCRAACDPDDEIDSALRSLPPKSVRRETPVGLRDYRPLATVAHQFLDKPMGALRKRCWYKYSTWGGAVLNSCDLHSPVRISDDSSSKTVWVIDTPAPLGWPFRQESCALPHVLRYATLVYDGVQPILDIHFDGERIIVSTTDGANVLTF